MEPLIADNTTAALLAPRPINERSIATLNTQDFFKILISELQAQDPLEPAKTSDMIGQVSQIRSIELSTKLGDTLDSLVQQQRMAGIADFLGKYVTAVTIGPDGSVLTAEGVVTGVTLASNGRAVLELDTGHAVRIEDVVHVTTLEQKEQLEAASSGSGESLSDVSADKQEAQSAVKQPPKKPSWFSLDWSVNL